MVFISSALFVFLPCSAQLNTSFHAAAFPGSIRNTGTAGIKAPGAVSTVTIQSTSDCDSCGKNIDLLMVNTTVPDTVYLIHLDGTGHAVRPGIWNGHYNFMFSEFMCSSVMLNNIPVLHDTTIAFNTAGAKPPVTNVYVNDRSLQATWVPPRQRETYLYENWNSGNFTANQWTTSGGTNWSVTPGSGNPSPTAIFNWTPQVTNYHQYLTSRYVSSHHAPHVQLRYDYFLSNFGTTSVNNLAVEVWSGATWHVLKTYDNQGGNIPWTSETLNITSYADSDFRVRFHAYGVDSYDINNWNVDNVQIIGTNNTLNPPGCFLGENVYVNNLLGAFLNDTTYFIPPQQLIFGQLCQFCVKGVYNGGYSVPACTTFTCKYLYPPKSFTVTPLECAASLEWEKPDDSLAKVALSGYDIYRNVVLVHHVGDPDSLKYDDLNLTPGYYRYAIVANYNLGIYGFTGQTGSSLMKFYPPGLAGSLLIHCGIPMPFHENFQMGNFSFYDWSFEPDQGNWGISTYEKSSAPFADFSWNPVRNNYSYAMVSEYIDAYSWKCASLWLDLDYKLVDHNGTGNEKLKIEAWFENTWHTLKVLSNTGSVDWTTLHLPLSDAAGRSLKIRFVATGANSGDIMHWYVDNISVYGICASPVALTAVVNGHQAELNWNSPPCVGSASPSGYNVYRTGPGGAPPFALRNQGLVTGTSFIEDIDPNATYYYYVTAVSIDSLLMEPVCESAGSDTVVVSTVPVPEKWNKGSRVYPNPAGGTVTVQSDREIVSLEILNYRGQPVASYNNCSASIIRLDVSTYPPGIYIFRITDRLVTKNLKVIIAH